MELGLDQGASLLQELVCCLFILEQHAVNEQAGKQFWDFSLDKWTKRGG